MSLGTLASRIERLASAVSIGARRVLSLDTNPVPAAWTHITKVDPEARKHLPLLFVPYLSHTSAVSVGGSSAVTGENTAETFELIDAASVPAVHEPSAARHVTATARDQADFLAVPEVLNGDVEALVGTLGRGVSYVRDDLGPRTVEGVLGLAPGGTLGDRLSDAAAAWLLEEAVFEAYIIMNPDSAAAREANVDAEDCLSPQVARERALAAEYHLDSEIVYLEYSGTYGGAEATELLETIDDGCSWSRIWYGGGVDSREKAQQVLNAGADAVVVGDAFHEVAAEEQTLYERATERFDDDPGAETMREWVTTTVEPDESKAARYLSTVPEVPSPARRAVRYLATGLRLGLALRTIADELEGSAPDTQQLRTAVAEQPLPGESTFADVLDSGASKRVREIGVAMLADRLETDLNSGLPTQHIGITL